jgi:hypothetical protein
MSLVAAVLAAGVLAGAHASAPADSGRFALELRGGAAIGQVRAAAGPAERIPGPAWRVGGSYALARFLDASIGFGSSGFGCRTGFCQDNNVRFTGTGLDAGLRVHGGAAWARAGLVRHTLHSRADAQAGPITARSAPAVGWEAGAGVQLGLGRGVQLAPGVRYATYRAAFDGGPAEAVGYLTGDVGVRVAFR